VCENYLKHLKNYHEYNISFSSLNSYQIFKKFIITIKFILLISKRSKIIYVPSPTNFGLIKDLILLNLLLIKRVKINFLLIGNYFNSNINIFGKLKHFLKLKVINYGLIIISENKNKLLQNKNLIVINNYTLKLNYKNKNEKKTIPLFFNHISETKGFMYFIDHCIKIKNDYKNIDLNPYIIGSPLLKEDYEILNQGIEKLKKEEIKFNIFKKFDISIDLLDFKPSYLFFYSKFNYEFTPLSILNCFNSEILVISKKDIFKKTALPMNLFIDLNKFEISNLDSTIIKKTTKDAFVYSKKFFSEKRFNKNVIKFEKLLNKF